MQGFVTEDTMSELKGRVALVTGAARGLGAASSKALADKGAKVVLSDVRDGRETANAVGGAFVKHDVTSEEEWISAVTFAKETFGGLDILVNNAGVFWVKPTAEETLESFRKMQQINVEGVFLGLKHAIPAIAERAHQWDGGGAVVNLSSVAGIVGGPNIIAYNASKGAVRLMTKSAALESAALKVRVNSVHPGIIDTPMMAEAASTLEKVTGQGHNEIRSNFADRHPLKRMGRDIDVANAVAFLASDAAAFITGSELVVDGGMTAI
jgi:NAD(P)-dependent dehydrogenase (short-subunit alcohol dehydrogenase family)